MLRSIFKILGVMTLLVVIVSPVTKTQNITPDYDNQNYYRVKIDRYLDVEIWTNQSDGEYYEDDNIVMHFRTNRDAFVVIYTIDSRGRVNLLFPTEQGKDNFIEGGTTYHLPGGGDDFDLVVNGPEGVENIQIIASKERFPIPDWYPNSGLIFDGDDRYGYMDYLNNRYFVRYDGQRFAFDRTSIYINEWEEDYYRPVYYPYYPSWTDWGNVYIDYPYGGSVYINGIYWGTAPLYVPRLYVGWHTFTIYDPYGYCWESDFHLNRYNTIVLTSTIVRTSPRVRSKYKEVRYAGYRNPVDNGYPNYKTKKVIKSSKTVRGSTSGEKTVTKTYEKKYVRGSTKIVKTERGYETVGKSFSNDKKSKSRNSSKKTYKSKSETGFEKGKSSKSSSSDYSYGKRNKTSKSYYKSKVDRKSSGEKSSGYYQKKSGSSFSKKSVNKRSYKESSKSGKSGKVKNRSSSSSNKKSPAIKKGSSKPKSSGSGKSSKSSKSYKGSKSSGNKSSGKVSSPPARSKSGKSSSGGRKSSGGKKRR